MTDLMWRNPPLQKKGPGSRRQLAEVAYKLMKREPGRWILLKHYRSRTAAWTSRRIFREQGLLLDCELKANREQNGGPGSDLFARYIGRNR